jgi:hypothetical protein
MSETKDGEECWKPHPRKPWFPNIPGHAQNRGSVNVSSKLKDILVARTKRIEKETLERQAKESKEDNKGL